MATATILIAIVSVISMAIPISTLSGSGEDALTPSSTVRASTRISRGVPSQGSSATATATPTLGAGSIVANIPIGIDPQALAYDASNGELYVANYDSNNISVISGSVLVATVTLPPNSMPKALAYDNGTGVVYVADSGGNDVSLIYGTTVVTSFGVGSQPVAEIYDPESGYIYIAENSSNSVTIVSGVSIVATVPVGVAPDGLVFDSGNGDIYVANGNSQNVSVINGTKPVGTVDVSSNPHSMVYDGRDGDIYVSDEYNVSVISGTTLVTTIGPPSLSLPGDLAYDPENAYVYVPDTGTRNVSVIDGSAFLSQIWVEYIGPEAAAYDAWNGYVYVACADGAIAVLNGTTIVTGLDSGDQNSVILFDPWNGDIYVTSAIRFYGGIVTVLNMTFEDSEVDVYFGQEAIAYDSGDGYVYVANTNCSFSPCGQGSVNIISGTTVKATVGVGDWPTGVAYDSGNGLVYVTNYDSGSVSVINGTTVVATVGVGNGPTTLDYDSGNGYVYVTNSASSTVSVLSGVSQVATIPVGTQPSGLALDPANGYIYVANFYSGNLSLIDGTMVVGSVDVPNEPRPDELVSCGHEGLVYVIGGANSYNVSVVNGTSVAAVLPVGQYTNAVGCDTADGIAYIGAARNVTLVDGTTAVAKVDVGIGLTAFVYDGGNGYEYVSTGANTVCALEGASIVYTEGTGQSPIAMAYDDGNGYVYVANSEGNTVSIVLLSWSALAATPATLELGETIALNVTTTAGSPPYVYSYFNLPPGCAAADTRDLYCTPTASGNFTVTVVVTEANGFEASHVVNLTVTPATGPLAISSFVASPSTVSVGETTDLVVSATGGTGALHYSYTGLPTGCGSEDQSALPCTPTSSGSFLVKVYVNDSASDSVNAMTPLTVVPIAKSSYEVTFSESGLPSGTSWSVTLNTTTNSDTGNISFMEPNGTYSFSVGAVTGYKASQVSGTIIVDGKVNSTSIAFTALSAGRYSAIFSESGLPTGTNWSVTFFGLTEASTASTIAFTPFNGTWTFTIGIVEGYTASPESGSITIKGASQVYNITFTKSSIGEATYAVTFTETGLTNGTSWSVTLNGSTLSSTTTTITFQEANGSYAFLVGTVNGYNASPTSGTVKVSGGAASQTVVFASSSSKSKTNQTTGFLGLSGDTGYILIGAIVAVVAIAVALLLLRGRGQRPAPSTPSNEEPGSQEVEKSGSEKTDTPPEPEKKD